MLSPSLKSYFWAYLESKIVSTYFFNFFYNVVGLDDQGLPVERIQSQKTPHIYFVHVYLTKLCKKVMCLVWCPIHIWLTLLLFYEL